MKLYITTLGDFDMLVGGKSIMGEASRSYKLFKLLEYFLTFKNKKLMPETIIENLWQDQDSMDPKNMIRGQIFRLRQILKDILPGEDYLKITFNNGYYTLEVGEDVILDTDQMEDFIAEGDRLLTIDRMQAAKTFKMAFELYRGGYLAENPYEIWLVPVRSYYKRMYVKTVDKLVELYTEKGRDEEIVNICERAISIEPFEERIHKYLIEGLLRTGKLQSAHNHFDYMRMSFAKEMGLPSSSIMREIQRKIEGYSTEKGDLTVDDINGKLAESKLNGPLKCESEHFKFLYNSFKRRRRSDNENDHICLITKAGSEDEDYGKWQTAMTNVLEKTLRKGDIFTLWNDAQILLLLPEVKNGGVQMIEERIKGNMKAEGCETRGTSFKFTPVENIDGLTE